MTMSAAISVYALGLGEIQVSSVLGEPLKARVNLRELSYADAHDLKVGLANADEYKKIGLQYPEGIKFNFQFINEQGKPPYIDISTRRPIDEPFLTLLLEVASASGNIVKDYTFLIDPAPGLMSSPVAAQPAAKARRVEQAATREAAANDLASAAEPARPAVIEEPVRSAKRQKRKPATGSLALPDAALRAAGRALGDDGDRPGKRSYGKLALSLSTSLSISRYAPGQPETPAANRDALQDELIAKEKMVSELNAQIAEMQAVIKLLQLKLGIQAGSAVAGSDLPAQAAAIISIPEAAAGGAVTGKAGAAPVPVAQAEDVSGLHNRFWPGVAGVIAVLLLGAASGFWYRKHKANGESAPGIFDDLNVTEEVPQQESAGADRNAAEQPLKTPGYKGLKTTSISSPEYDLLEQADTYLRFGHDKLAEDVLREAIRINPINPHGYLTLLGIYETRGDAKTFYALAQQLKAIGDVADWKKAAEMGRKLEPANPFYSGQ